MTLPEITLPVAIDCGVVVGWLAIVGCLAFLAHRSFPTWAESVRKVVHIGTGNVILLAWWLQIPPWVAIVASFFFSILALISSVLPVLPGINNVGRKSFGTLFYALSIGILVAWFWPLQYPQFAVLGILIMAWGDGFAALIGQRWGQHPYKVWGMKKSWEGSLAMALISGVISGVVLGSLPLSIGQVSITALSIALVATVLEAFSKWGIDNLTVPLATALGGFWLTQTWL